MTFTSPFQHKCPACTCDLFEHLQDKLFINAFTIRKFECPNCKTLLSWERDNNLLIVKYGFCFIICISIIFPIFSYFFGVINIGSLILMGVAAISSVLALFSLLRMQIAAHKMKHKSNQCINKKGGSRERLIKMVTS